VTYGKNIYVFPVFSPFVGWWWRSIKYPSLSP